MLKKKKKKEGDREEGIVLGIPSFSVSSFNMNLAAFYSGYLLFN